MIAISPAPTGMLIHKVSESGVETTQRPGGERKQFWRLSLSLLKHQRGDRSRILASSLTAPFAHDLMVELFIERLGGTHSFGAAQGPMLDEPKGDQMLGGLG